MSEALDAIRKLQSSTIEDTLGQLTTLERRRREDPRVISPGATLHLHSGRDLFGQVLEVGELRGAKTVMLHVGVPGPLPMSTNVAMIPLHAIEAITLHDAHRAGRIHRTGDAPGKLGLQRQSEAISKELGEKLGRPLALALDLGGTSESDEVRFRMAELLEQVQRLLLELIGDPIGREALLALNRIQLGHAEELEARKEGDALVLRAPLEQGAPPASADDLKRTVEAAL